MNIIRITILAFAAVIAYGSTAYAAPIGIVNDSPQALSGTPLQIESCVVSPSIPVVAQNVASAGLGFLGGRIGGVAGVAVALGGAAVSTVASTKSRLDIRLSNEGGTAVTAFRIRVEGAGAPIFEREDFRIAPGDMVSRRYDGRAFGTNGNSNAVGCSVDWIAFANGTTWSNSTYRSQASR